MKKLLVMDSPLGRMGIAENGRGLSDVFILYEELPMDMEMAVTPLLEQAAQQLQEYFTGQRQDFQLALAPAGTAFQQKVWAALRSIPYGQTRSYGQVAAAIGQPKAARAIGNANNRNPIMIITPCHRVIGSDGRLVGYASGLEHKEFLLQLEGAWKRP